MFSNFSIRARIASAFSLLVLLLLVVAACGQFGNTAGRDALRATYEVQLSSAVAVGQAKYSLAIARISIDRAMLHPDAPEVKTLDLPKAQEYIQTARKAYARYLAIPKKVNEQRLAEAVSKSFEDLVALGIEPTLEALKAGDTANADRITMTVTRNLSLDLTKNTALLDSYLIREGAANYEQFQSTLSTVSVASGVVLAIAVVIALVCAVGLHRAISRPLAKALDACSAIAKGDLSQPVDRHGRDEMSVLLQGLAAMQTGLRETVSTVRSSSDSMATATHEIAAGNADLSRRTESQAAALQQTAASMEELTATVRQNNESTGNAKKLAIQAMEIAQTGGSVMDRVVETMSKINAQSTKIATIIETIEGIAFQTNILALNAAVEAARAGEQGRGFAVVATEVRTLAQRSSNAAKEIKLLIENAVMSMAEGTGLVGAAGATMNEIVQASQTVSGILNEVAAASKEQRDGIEQINRAVLQMDEVTQQNAALVEETTAAALSLTEQATLLREAVARFIT